MKNLIHNFGTKDVSGNKKISIEAYDGNTHLATISDGESDMEVSVDECYRIFKMLYEIKEDDLAKRGL